MPKKVRQKSTKKGHSVVVSGTGITMGITKVSGMAAPTATGDALRKGTPITTTELPALTSGKIWAGNVGNRPVEEDKPGAFPSATVGDYLETSANIERTTTETAEYVKVKEIVLGRVGIYRVKFRLWGGGAGKTAYGRIYKNGVAHGTEQSESGSSYVEKSEDIAGWSQGDLLQLYLKATTGNTAYGKELRIYTGNPITNSVITN